MSGKARTSLLHFLWPLLILGLIVAAVSSPGLRRMIAEAIEKIGPWAVLATLPGQLLAALLCAAALFSLRPGVSFWGSLGSRLLRDAGDNLLVFFPGIGEIIGARALVLAGGRTRAAISASVLDKLSETVAQIPYILIAVVILWHNWQWDARTLGMPALSLIMAVLLGIAVLVALAAAVWHAQPAWLLRAFHRLRAEWALLVAEFHARKGGLPLATLFHFLAWGMGGLQFWMAGHALGLGLTIFEAIAIESIAYAGRAVAFFIPAGLVMQEAALVAGGLAFGLAPEQSLALALVLRLRDVVFGLPLLAWPAYEYRHGRLSRQGASQ